MTTNRTLSPQFEGFSYKAHEIAKYLSAPCIGLFTIALKNTGDTIHFTPKNPTAFQQWLGSHNIMDIRSAFLHKEEEMCH